MSTNSTAAHAPTEVAAGGAAAAWISAGTTFRIIDVGGRQIGDFVALAAADLDERLSTAETMNFNDWSARVVPGTQLFSNKPRPMFTVVEDTSSGRHDLNYAACTAEFYAYYGGGDSHANCHDNLVAVLEPHGMRSVDLPNPLNLFQVSMPGADGTVEVGPPGALAGEYIALRAEMDVIIAVSSCPFDLDKAGGAGWVATPLRIQPISTEES